QDADVRTHVALLRAINLAGRNRVAMADLRQMATSLGHTEVATYIQSGNVVFTTTQTDTGKLAETLEQEIGRCLDVRPGVVVLSRDQLAEVIADNPYPQAADPRCLHAVFRRQDLSQAEIAAVAAARQRARVKGSRDEVTVVRRTLFLYTPDGMGRSELATQLARSTAATGTGTAGTARNRATVTRLLDQIRDCLGPACGPVLFEVVQRHASPCRSPVSRKMAAASWCALIAFSSSAPLRRAPGNLCGLSFVLGCRQDGRYVCRGNHRTWPRWRAFLPSAARSCCAQRYS